MSLGCNQARLSRYRHGAFSPRFRHSKGTPDSKDLADFGSEHVACQTMIELHSVDSIGVVGRSAERLWSAIAGYIGSHSQARRVERPVPYRQSPDYIERALSRARRPSRDCGPAVCGCCSVREADGRTHTIPLVVETNGHSSVSCDGSSVSSPSDTRDIGTLDTTADSDAGKMLA